MPQKNIVNGNAAIKNDDSHTRVTSARSLYRHMTPAKKVTLVPGADIPGALLSKEEDCCSRATD